MIITKNFTRQQRVATEIRKVLSEFLLRNSIVDKECNMSLISVTDVTISPCLQHAKIFVIPISNEISNDQCLTCLEKHKSKFKAHIGNSIRMKYVPDLCFFIDNSFEYAEKIDALLKTITY